jgi:hypothetical protein
MHVSVSDCSGSGIQVMAWSARKSEGNEYKNKPSATLKNPRRQGAVYSAAARCFLRRSRSSVIVSFVPLPLGKEIQGLVPSPMTKMLDRLRYDVSYLNRILNPKDHLIPGSCCPVESILDVHNIETTNVLLTVDNDTRATHVTTTSDHNDVANIKLDEVGDLVLFEVELDSIVDLDSRVRVPDRTAIVGDDVWDTLGTKCNFANLQELVCSFLRRDAMDGEAALDIVKNAEVLAGFFDRDDIFHKIKISGKISVRKVVFHTLETSRVCVIGADLGVNLDKTLLGDQGDLAARKRVL